MRITVTPNYSINLPTDFSKVIPTNPIVRIALLTLAAIVALATLVYYRRAPSAIQLRPSQTDTPPNKPTEPPPEVIIDQYGLVELFQGCLKAWAILTFDQILDTQKEQLEKVLAAPLKSDTLRRMLVLKTADMSAIVILQKCPSLFRSGYFNFTTQKDRSSPTLRERFEAEVKSYAEIQSLEESYGPEFPALKLFSKEFVQRLQNRLPIGLDDEDVSESPQCCENDWKELTFDQLLTTQKEQLEAVLTAPKNADPRLRKLLLEKTQTMSAVEILKKCPLLFKHGYFRFDTRIDRNSPSFRERFEKEVKSYAELEQLAQDFGAGFYSLNLFSPEFLDKQVTFYIYEHPKDYLLGKLKPASNPDSVRRLSQQHWETIYRIQDEYFAAVQGKEGAEKEQVEEERKQKEQAVFDAFKKDLGKIVEKYDQLAKSDQGNLALSEP